MKQRWTPEEKFLFSTQKLRSSRVPDKRKQDSKRACRRKFI